VTIALRKYQEVGRDFLSVRRRALLADQMRVGKTPQAILAAAKAGARSALVLTPAIAVNQWKNEWRRWWPDCKFEPEVYGYERARMKWRDGDFNADRGFKVDAFIVDECHRARNPEAGITAMVYGKNGIGHRAGAIWPLSGTPAVKHAGELWPMMRAFGVVGMTYNEFTRRYCWFKADDRIGGTREKMIPELKEILDTFMLRRTRKDVAPDMPDVDFQLLEVEGTPLPDMGIPTWLEPKSLLAWLEAHAGSLAEYRNACAMAKAPALTKHVDFALGNALLKQAVVFGHHVEPLEYVADELAALGYQVALINGKTPLAQRDAAVAGFANGTYDVVCANIQTAGTAIPLHAASHGFFLELDWLPGNNLQAAFRMVSMEKAEPVTCDVATWPGSADDAVQKVLTRRVKELAQLY
jgi:SWI/SNF-related matrix-associated actin-dependent regulator 1 of chromatin subfamily A